MQKICGPYQVTDSDLRYHSTLDATDLDEWYIIINGAMQFVESEEHGRELVNMLSKLN